MLKRPWSSLDGSKCTALPAAHLLHPVASQPASPLPPAQVLCDRLGIFVDGQLVCVGAPKEITARYGGYLVRVMHLTLLIQGLGSCQGVIGVSHQRSDMKVAIINASPR